MAVVTRFPSSVEQDGSTPLMTNPANIEVQDNTGATFLFNPGGSVFTGSVRTFGYNFDGTLPDGSTINTVKAILRFKFPGGGTTGSSGVGYTIRTYIDGVAQTALFSPSPRGADLYSSYVNEVIDMTSIASWTRDNLLDGSFKITAEFNFNGITSTVDADSLSVQVDYTPGVDTNAPVLQSAVVNGSSLVLIYNELIVDSTGTPTVRVNGVIRTFTPNAASGTTKILTLSSAVSSSDVVVISYPSGYIKDSAGNLTISQTNRNVINVTGDSLAPTLTSKVIDFQTLTLIYSENMQNGSGAATVKVNGTSVAFTSTPPSGSTKVLTLTVPICSSDTVTITYPAGYVKDLAGNNAASQTNASVTNSTDADSTVPTRTSAVVNFTDLTLTFSEYIVDGSGPATVKVNGSSVSITEIPASGNTKHITVSSGVLATDTVTISYPSGYVHDVCGNNIASATDAAVGNTTAPPSTLADVNVDDFVYFGDNTPVQHEYHLYGSDSGGNSVTFQDFDGIHLNEFHIYVEDFGLQWNFFNTDQISGNFPKTFTIAENLPSNFFKETLKVLPDPLHIDDSFGFADIAFATTDDHTDFDVLDNVFFFDQSITPVLIPNPYLRNVGDTVTWSNLTPGVERGHYVNDTVIFLEVNCISSDVHPSGSDTVTFSDTGLWSVNGVTDPRNFTTIEDVGGFTLTAPIRKRITEAFGFAEYSTMYDSDGNLIVIDPCHPRIPPDIPDFDRTISETLTVTELAEALFTPSWRMLSEEQWRDLSTDDWLEVLEDQSSVPDLPASAVFVSSETTIKGSWVGQYGHDGYAILVDGDTIDALPSAVSWTRVDTSPVWTWASSATGNIDTAVYQQDPGATDQKGLSAAYGSLIQFDMHIGEHETKYITFYGYDPDGGRSYKIEIWDTIAGTMLATSTFSTSDTATGTNVTFEAYGHLTIKVILISGTNALFFGFFIDPTTSVIKIPSLRVDLDPNKYNAANFENQASPLGEYPTYTTAPTIETNVVNTLPVYRFNNHKLTFQNSILRFATAMTAFVVVRLDVFPSSDANHSGLWNFSNADNGHFPYPNGLIYEAFGTAVRKDAITPGVDLSAQYQVYEIAADTNFYEIRINGTVIYSDSTNTFAKTTIPFLGMDANSVYCLVGRIARFLFFTRQLTALERTAIRDELMDVYQ